MLTKAAVWSLPKFYCAIAGFPKKVLNRSAFCPRYTASTKRRGPVHPCSVGEANDTRHEIMAMRGTIQAATAIVAVDMCARASGVIVHSVGCPS